VKLADLRKLSIRRQIRIRFPIRNGMECVVNEHGVAQVPGLRSIPDFNLEQELDTASSFVIEPVAPSSKPQQIPRDELASMLSPEAPAAAQEHEEE
jgi:hypothetical protein